MKNMQKVRLTLEQLELIDTKNFTPEQLVNFEILKKLAKQEAVLKQAARNKYYKDKKKKKKIADKSRWINRLKAKAGKAH